MEEEYKEKTIEEEEDMCSACDTETDSGSGTDTETDSSFVIKIKRLDNSALQVTGLTPDSDIQDLKAKLQQQTGVLPENQRLIFRGKALSSGSLRTHHIENESWLHLVERDPNRVVRSAPTDSARIASSSTGSGQRQTQISLSDALGDSMSLLLASALRSGSRSVQTAVAPSRHPFHFEEGSLEHIWQGLNFVDSMVTSFEELASHRNRATETREVQGLQSICLDLDDLAFTSQEHVGGEGGEEITTVPGIRRFECGQWIDVLDTVNQWLEATVMHVSPDGMKILVHYNAWGERWDEVLDVRSERIAPFRTKTKHRDNCQNLSATPARWVKSAPRIGDGNLQDLLPKALNSIERVLPILRDVCTAENTQTSLDRVLYLAPIFDRMGRLLGDVAAKLAENPTLAPRKRFVAFWPFTALGQSVLPFSLYMIAPKDSSRRNVLMKQRGFDSEFLQLMNHTHEPSSRSGNLDIHIHAIVTPFQQPLTAEASDS